MFSQRTKHALGEDCKICHDEIKNSQGKIVCSTRECTYHKSCFKRSISFENDQAISLGRKGNKRYQRANCDCGNKITVFNSRWHILKQYKGFIVIPIIVLICL